MDTAQALLDTLPDSALTIIRAIDPDALGGAEERGRRSLLLAAALDKCGIDTTDATIIAPALAWYRHHGTADDRLKALYYAGRIAGNSGDQDKEMDYYVQASQYQKESTDTLAICRLLVAEGVLYHEIYDLESELDCVKEARNLSNAVGRADYALSCNRKILTDACMLKDKELAYSALSQIQALSEESPEFGAPNAEARIMYAVTFENDSTLKCVLNDILKDYTTQLSEDAYLDLVKACVRLEDYLSASQILSSLPLPEDADLRVKYYIQGFMIGEGTGQWEDALEYYKNYNALCDSIESRKFAQRLQFSEEKYSLTLAAAQAKSAHKELWYLSTIIVLLLLFVVGILLWLYVSNRNKSKSEEQLRKLAETERHMAQLKAELLEAETENLKINNERTSLMLEQLSQECDGLKHALKRSENLDPALLTPLKQRSQMLDRFLLGQITNNKDWDQGYRDWVASMVNNRQELFRELRLSFQAYHPAVYSFLISKGITHSEMNFICLYAMGLRGNEVGYIMDVKRHYSISSTIRKKLGLNAPSPTLTSYIQALINAPEK